jgi:outer membrane protein assembly factor BamD
MRRGHWTGWDRTDLMARIAKSLLALALACTLAACGDDGTPPVEDQAPEAIYLLAEAELADGDAEDAAQLFSEVERLYPYSEWAKRAIIMQAFSYHADRDYENARAAAQRYLDFYPADEDAAYAQYLLALSYYDQIELVGRDQGLTFLALQELRATIELYPDSDWARSARPKFDLAFDHLAAKEMEIGRYYLRRGHYPAAINRFRAVVEDFQTTTHTPEALLRLVESYLSLGLLAEAQTAGAILGYNYRGSPFYDDAYRQLTGRGLTPEAAQTGWLAEIYRRTVRGDPL